MGNRIWCAVIELTCTAPYVHKAFGSLSEEGKYENALVSSCLWSNSASSEQILKIIFLPLVSFIRSVEKRLPSLSLSLPLVCTHTHTALNVPHMVCFSWSS